MAKIIREGDESFRIRRGVKVKIPVEWVGQVPHPQTMRKRDSKKTNKHRREDSLRNVGKSGYYDAKFLDARESMIDEDA